MRRGLYISGGIVAILIGLALTVTISKSGKAKASGAQGRPNYEVQVIPWGPDQAAFDQAGRSANANVEVKRYLKGTRHRLIAVQMLEDENKDGGQRIAPTRYLATFYDYTNNRAIFAEGRFDRTGSVTVTESHYQMEPSNEEFAEAVSILERDSNLGPRIRDKSFEVYAPMPPVLSHATDDPTVERTINVGLLPRGSGVEHEIVGINLVRQSVVRFPDKAPPTVDVSPDACGVTASGSSSARSLAGSYQVMVSKDGEELWNYMVNRPSSSSGSQGSGIELIDVKYKGKMMLKRANIPVLNVKYLPGGNCNEFRDWQYNESKFTASGTDVVSNPAAGSGIRVCLPSQGCSAGPATTIVETRNDAGNFNGVAIYQEGTQIVLVTEMSAGWYRYLNEYSFDEDGTIRPRYGFGSTTNSCTCSPRVHHAYWRFDFDINGANNNVYELNYGFAESFYELNTGRKWQKLITSEYTQLRNEQTRRRWLITNPTTGEAVMVSPNPQGKDGTASLEGQSVFAQSDVWLLRYKTFPTEVSDTSGNNSGINLAPYFSTPEPTANQDIVLWYGVHLRRDDDTSREGWSSDRLNGIYTPGPEIRPINW